MQSNKRLLTALPLRLNFFLVNGEILICSPVLTLTCLTHSPFNLNSYTFNLQYFFRDIRNLDIFSNEDLNFVKAKTKEAALLSYRSYNIIVPQYLSQEEFIALQNLYENKYLNIKKSDKGNSAVIAQRQDYLKKMDDILSDQKKFRKVSLKDDTLLHFAINQEKHVDKVLKKLVESRSMSEKNYEILKTSSYQTSCHVRFI